MAGVLSELSDDIHPERLVEASQSASIPWTQLLGYLLEYIGAGQLTIPFRKYVQQHTRNSTMLVLGVDSINAI